MFYIIDTEEQLRELSNIVGDNCFVSIIKGNDNIHPVVESDISLVYVRPLTHKKGYIILVDHSEGFSISSSLVLDFLNNIENIYCLNKKYILYFIERDNIFDITFMKTLIHNNYIDLEYCHTNAYKYYYNNYPQNSEVNKLIPVSKHYEKEEFVFNAMQRFITLPENLSDAYLFYNDSIIEFFNVEKNGIKLDKNKFIEHFDNVNTPQFSIKSGRIYTEYNLYNLTSRPSNSFNNINFSALNKDDNRRQAFIPQNDFLVEFDYKGFHINILLKFIKYDFNDVDVYTHLGKQYFNKTDISKDEYIESKQLTFKLLYSDKIPHKYMHIDFLQKVHDFKNKIWDNVQLGKKLKSPISGKIIEGIDTKSKILPYLFQVYETEHNAIKIRQLNKILQNKQTKLILYTYDAFLLDYSKDDGSQCLSDIKNTLEQGNFTVAWKYGKNYDSLKSF